MCRHEFRWSSYCVLYESNQSSTIFRSLRGMLHGSRRFLVASLPSQTSNETWFWLFEACRFLNFLTPMPFDAPICDIRLSQEPADVIHESEYGNVSPICLLCRNSPIVTLGISLMRSMDPVNTILKTIFISIRRQSYSGLSSSDISKSESTISKPGSVAWSMLWISPPQEEIKSLSLSTLSPKMMNFSPRKRFPRLSCLWGYANSKSRVWGKFRTPLWVPASFSK